jgi:hypothetical protein
MHFLSHYYVDRQRNNPLFVLGALVPDIVPHFTKTYNHKIRYTEWDLQEPLLSLHQGVLRHYELDAAFHSSLVFKESCAFATECMLQEGLDREKYRFWFLAHIVTEVMLDRQLIIENPGLVDEYYEMLRNVDINKFDAYLNFLVSEGEKNKILTNFIRFLDVRFLQYMKTTDGAAEGIVRTAQRATGVTFPDIDRGKLIAALHNIEDGMRYRSEKLLEL